MIFGTKENRYWDARKILALLALAAAIAAARGAGNYLAYAGVSYYLVCIAAILLRFRWAGCLLWFAVGVHVLLTGWSFWEWHSELIIPCRYCLWAAGFVLLAATAFYRLPAAVLPVLLMVGASAAWPYAFGEKALEKYYSPAGKTTVQPVSAPGNNEPGENEETSLSGESPGENLPAEPGDAAAENPAPAKTSPAVKPAPTVTPPPQPEPGTPGQNETPDQPAGAGSQPAPEQTKQDSPPEPPEDQPDPGVVKPGDQSQVVEPGDNGGGEPEVEEPPEEPGDNGEDEPKKPTSG